MKRVAKNTIGLGEGKYVEPGKSVDLTKDQERKLEAAGALEPKGGGKAAEDPGPSKPAGKKLAEAVAGAIKQLEPENPDAFNAEGKPAFAPLAQILGYEILHAERDAGWDLFKQQNPDLFKSGAAA